MVLDGCWPEYRTSGGDGSSQGTKICINNNDVWVPIKYGLRSRSKNILNVETVYIFFFKKIILSE